MPYSENSLQIMSNESEQISSGVSGYMLNDIRVTTDSLYPNDPSIKYQNSGLYKNSDSKFIDVNSEILNITRPLTKDVNGVWAGAPASDIVGDIELNDTKFASRYSRLDEPAFELRGATKNRWIELPLNPQENVIEPFRRLGSNTHLSLVDHYKC
tara:strand:- start:28 stop:492 length:465 start_codon:yes stop_codon:yes gene_type:complete